MSKPKNKMDLKQEIEIRLLKEIHTELEKQTGQPNVFNIYFCEKLINMLKTFKEAI